MHHQYWSRSSYLGPRNNSKSLQWLQSLWLQSSGSTPQHCMDDSLSTSEWCPRTKLGATSSTHPKKIKTKIKNSKIPVTWLFAGFRHVFQGINNKEQIRNLGYYCCQIVLKVSEYPCFLLYCYDIIISIDNLNYYNWCSYSLDNLHKLLFALTNWALSTTMYNAAIHTGENQWVNKLAAIKQ